MPRVYTRKFDYEEARRRHAAGESLASIAAWAGVSVTRIRHVVFPEEGERARARADAYRWACPDCGAPTTHKGSRCKTCAALAQATSVRSTELQCVICKEWKPDEDFPHNRAARSVWRGRHSTCRACQTTTRRERRRRNPDSERAYQREYRRRKRKEQSHVADR